MKMTYFRTEMPLKSCFRISRGAISVQQTVVVELEHAGIVGRGEAPQHQYYGHTLVSIEASLRKLNNWLEDCEFSTPERMWDDMFQIIGDDLFALCAVDQAMHDLYGKLTGQPTYLAQGLSWSDVPLTSVTLSLGSVEQVMQEMDSWADWPIYKIKLGSPHDVETIRAIRERTDAVIRVDANCAWNVENAIQISYELKELDVEFLEQPLAPETSAEDQELLFRESALPIIADESCVREKDVIGCYGRFHGINIKLSKCGGLTPAFRMLRRARKLGMLTMTGCMIESDIGISAATHLLPLLDFADLDGSLLLGEQPFEGVQINKGVICQPAVPGNGGRLMTSPC